MKSQLSGSTYSPFQLLFSFFAKSISQRSTQTSQGKFRPLLGGLLTLAIALAGGLTNPVAAAERLTLKIGPIERSVEVDDLETFAETGEVPHSLGLYSTLLTPQVREILNKRLQVDPNVGDKFLDELFGSRDGDRLIDQLRIALPESRVDQLKAALYLALRQTDGMSALGFLKVYPSENLTIDVTSAVGLALQLNSSYLESRILGPLLEDELEDESETAFVPSFDPGLQGEQTVRQRTFILRDRDRKRSIPVDLYYGEETQGPTVVMSHGFGADRRFMTYLANHLASHGFSVVSLEHPGSNIHSLSRMSLGVNPTDIIAASEFVNRPQDISFVLDELRELGRGRVYFADKFNTQDVTVIGHSLGGYTALALAGGELNLRELRSFCQNLSPLGRSPADWLQCAAADLPESKLQLRDYRVRQVIALNPVIGHLFGNDGLEKINIPVMLLSSSEDAIAPALDHQLRPFRQIESEKYLLSAIGGTHLSVTDAGYLNDQIATNTLVKERLGAEAEPIRHWLRGVTLAFLHQETSEAEEYQPFLSSGYAQFLSPTARQQGTQIRLRFTKELPTTTNAWLQVMTLGSRKLALRPPQEKPSLMVVMDRGVLSAKRLLRKTEFYHGNLNRIFTGLAHNNDDLPG